MKSLSIAMMLTAALALTGCGDDSGDDPPVDAGPTLVDECLNPADEAVLMSDGGDASSIATDCATMDCFSFLISGTPEEQEMCMNTCMDSSTVAALSDNCTACYVNTALCAASQCAGQCFADPNATICTDCVATNCTPGFETCSGLTSSNP